MTREARHFVLIAVLAGTTGCGEDRKGQKDIHPNTRLAEYCSSNTEDGSVRAERMCLFAKMLQRTRFKDVTDDLQ